MRLQYFLFLYSVCDEKFIFITKIYSNIDMCYIIFTLLASFDKNKAKDRD